MYREYPKVYTHSQELYIFNLVIQHQHILYLFHHFVLFLKFMDLNLPSSHSLCEMFMLLTVIILYWIIFYLFYRRIKESRIV